MTVVADATGRRRASAGAALRCSGAWPECDDGGRVEQQWQAPVSWRVNPYDRIWQRFAGQVVITGAQRNRQATRLPLEAKGPGGRQLFDKAGAVETGANGRGQALLVQAMCPSRQMWNDGGEAEAESANPHAGHQRRRLQRQPLSCLM